MPKPNQELSEWIDIIDDADFISMGVGELLEIAAQKFPNTEALIYSHQPDIKNIRWTYKDLNEMSANLARGFLVAGFNPGDTVAVWGPNHPEWILIEYALAKAGLKLATLNPLYKERELIFALNASKVTGIMHADEIGGSEAITLIQSISCDVPSLDHIYSFTDGIENLIAQGETSSTELPKIDPKDIFMIQYTSGTTGTPKAAQMTHEALIT